MSPTRRQFIKEAAATGALTATAAELTFEKPAAATPAEPAKTAEPKCPYFDQPMYCKSLCEDGIPLCDKDKK